MRFDYRVGKEATFNDWVDDGIAKARLILSTVDVPEAEDAKDSEQNNK